MSLKTNMSQSREQLKEHEEYVRDTIQKVRRHGGDSHDLKSGKRHSVINLTIKPRQSFPFPPLHREMKLKKGSPIEESMRVVMTHEHESATEMHES